VKVDGSNHRSSSQTRMSANLRTKLSSPIMCNSAVRTIFSQYSTYTSRRATLAHWAAGRYCLPAEDDPAMLGAPALARPHREPQNMPRRSGDGSPAIHLQPRKSVPVSAPPLPAEPVLDGKSSSGIFESILWVSRREPRRGGSRPPGHPCH